MAENENPAPSSELGHGSKKNKLFNNATGSGQSQENMAAALEYQKQGFSVIPIKADKTPFIKWTPYQDKQADADQVRRWWKKWPDAWIGIVTGKISGITVIDADSEAGADAVHEFLPEDLKGIPIVKTPKGYHFYFQYVPGISNGVRVLLDTDVRNDGGYVIAPPSGQGRYAWMQK